MAQNPAHGYSPSMLKRSATLKILLALPLAFTLVWALVGAAQTTPLSPPLKADQLIGLKVEDSDGQKVGTIRNLVLDLRSGELKYVVIGSGGVLGLGNQLRLAPAEVISAATAKRSTLAIHVSSWRWRNAPAFKPSTLADLANPSRAKEISDYFAPALSQVQPMHPLSSTGHDANEISSPKMVPRFASNLIGARVTNMQGEKIGNVMDLLVSFGPPRPAFAIISTGHILQHGRQYAVPLSALVWTDQSKLLVLNAKPGSLQDPPPFNLQAWEAHRTNYFERVYLYSRLGD